MVDDELARVYWVSSCCAFGERGCMKLTEPLAFERDCMPIFSFHMPIAVTSGLADAVLHETSVSGAGEHAD
jgi:hypothetical protein